MIKLVKAKRVLPDVSKGFACVLMASKLFIEFVIGEAEYFFVTFWPITSVFTKTDNIWLLYIFL